MTVVQWCVESRGRGNKTKERIVVRRRLADARPYGTTVDQRSCNHATALYHFGAKLLYPLVT